MPPISSSRATRDISRAASTPKNGRRCCGISWKPWPADRAARAGEVLGRGPRQGCTAWGPHAGSRPPWNRWYHHALTGPGGRHAFHHSDYHPDPAADRCAADVALQFRLGLWTRRTSRADLDHRAHLGAAWQILIAFARLPDVSAQISTESARIRPNHAATLCVIEGSAPG